MSTSEPTVPPPLVDHSYVPGPCAYPLCGRSSEAHAEAAKHAAAQALATAPRDAEQHIVQHGMRVVGRLRATADLLAFHLDQAARSGKLEEVAGLVQDSVLPSIAPDLHPDLRALVRLAQPSGAAAPGSQHPAVTAGLPPPAVASTPSEEDVLGAFERLGQQP